ncbi:hypothetical protein [Pseudomonas veronii]|nr:hypothetical protein [Pseudomonas veronii]
MSIELSIYFYQSKELGAMSIKQAVEAAILLKKEGHPIAALSQALIAVSGSARKRFPKGTLSDNKAFKTFLGTELRRTMFGYVGDDDVTSGLVLGVDGCNRDMEFIFYDKYRNSLIHEAELSDQVELIKGADPTAVSINRANGKLAISETWIDLLLQAVRNAPCNGEEFGIKHYKLHKKYDFEEEEFVNELKKKVVFGYRLEVPFSIYLLKEFIFRNPEVDMTSAPDEQIVSLFKQGLQRRHLSGGAAVSYVASDMLTEDYTLTDTGLIAVREVAQKFIVSIV